MNIEENIDNISEVLPLRRTYKGYCSYCSGFCSSYDRLLRTGICPTCEYFRIPLMQKTVRKFLLKRKKEKNTKKDIIYRWFLKKRVSGKYISNKIITYL